MPDLDDAALRELLDLVFDFICERRLSDLVDPDRVVATLDESARLDRLEHWHTRLFVPMRARLIARGLGSTLPLGTWLPADVTDALSELLGAPAPLPRKLIDRVVASEQVRDNIRVTMQDALSAFVTKLGTPAPGSGGGGGLRGAIGFGARAMGAAASGLLGGVGEELQRQMQSRVRDFVDSSVSSVQTRIADKLTSDETARGLGKGRKKQFLALLAKTEADAAKTIAKGPHDKLDPLMSKVIAHNAARPEFRAALRDEIAAVVAELSKQTIGELLDQAGLRDSLRATVHAHALPLASVLVRTPGFEAWWARAKNAG